MHNQQVDERDSLAHVRHSTTNVDCAQGLWDASEVIERRLQALLVAIATVDSCVDGKAEVGKVCDYHANIDAALNAVTNGALADQEPPATRLVSELADLRRGQAGRLRRTSCRGQGRSSRQLPHRRDKTRHAYSAKGIDVDGGGAIGGGKGQLDGYVSHPCHQNPAVDLAGQLGFPIARRRTCSDDCVDVVTHAHHRNESF
mmetsp:Transcript_1613/g.4076  ORF Transcript_1613/g.4076 Transcript_1613/m.4076 type:complete len:201 (+) Transcript_1613:635-1237(+)